MLSPSSEPTAWTGILTAIAIAAIPFLRSVGVNISKDQADSGLALLAAVSVGLTILVRSKVTTVNKAESAVTTALTTQPTAATIAGADHQTKEILSQAKP